MRQLLFATAATLALSVPAMAQSQTQQPPTQAQQHQSQTQRIVPSRLSEAQIKQVQAALDKKGFHAKRADGVWGPETEAALRDFQRQQKLPGSGNLNEQTLAALGVNWQGQSATTGSGTNESSGSGSGAMKSNPSNSKPSHKSQMNNNSSDSNPAGDNK